MVCLALWPIVASAQTSSIAGVVRDASGGVLPGVTVEAASPALIEKVRSVVTDGTGQYKIINLRPGTYTVTFTLTGFTNVRREGIELTSDFTATVNADLKVGADVGIEVDLGIRRVEIDDRNAGVVTSLNHDHGAGVRRHHMDQIGFMLLHKGPALSVVASGNPGY